jgi:hypothetical protein
MLCELWAHTKYYVAKLNLVFDKVKEPWRFLMSLALMAPCWWGLSADSYNVRYITIAYLIALVVDRMYWHSWLQKHLRGDKS